MENWITVLIGAASGIIGGVISGGAYRDVRDYLVRPKLTIDYGGAGNRVETAHINKDKVAVSEIYIRLRLRNDGKRAAQNCVVFLTAITEVHPSGTTPTSFHDAMPLAWPGWEFSPRQIPRGIEFYVDLMRVSKNVSGWWISVRELAVTQADLRSYRGTYRFHVTAVADNAKPEKYEVDVSYDGDWHSLRAVGRN